MYILNIQTRLLLFADLYDGKMCSKRSNNQQLFVFVYLNNPYCNLIKLSLLTQTIKMVHETT